MKPSFLVKCSRFNLVAETKSSVVTTNDAVGGMSPRYPVRTA